MRRLFTVLVLLVVLMSLTTPVLAAKPQLHTATGGGTMTSYFSYVYSFNVQQLDDAGHARGRFMVILEVGTEHQSKLEADLMYVAVEGNTVWMSGVYTKSQGRLNFTGRSVVFGAQDTGDGKKATGPDKISAVVTGGYDYGSDYAINETLRNYAVDRPESWFDLTNGNVHVA